MRLQVDTVNPGHKMVDGNAHDQTDGPRLEAVDPGTVDAMADLLLEGYFAKAYFLGCGRSWHSGWINHYMPGSVSFDLQQLKLTAEAQRKRSCVFRIECIPMLVLRYEHVTLALAAINERNAGEYSALTAEIDARGPDFWAVLPEKASDWLLVFELGRFAPAAESHAPFVAKTMSGITPHPLIWKTLEGGGYELFFRFAGALLSKLQSPKSPASRAHSAMLRVA